MQVVAHRGSSGAYPEHTLQAFQAALAEGADAIECDVRLTRDGVPVCVHDRRVDRTSNGRGVVSTLELADLAELDFASWRTARAADTGVTDTGRSDAGVSDSVEPDRDAGRVLTLERLLQLVLAYRASTGRPVQLQVETKHPTRHGALVERGVVELLASYGLTAPATRGGSAVALLSYSPTSLRRVHAHAPLLPTVRNLDRIPLRLRAGVLPPHVWAAAVALPALRADPGFVRRVHDAGGRVHVFTVDDPEQIDAVLSLGVDAVVTNQPARVLQHSRRG